MAKDTSLLKGLANEQMFVYNRSVNTNKGGVLLHNMEERNVQLEAQIRKLLKLPLQADRHAIEMTLGTGAAITPALQERIDRVNKMQLATDALMSVLSENEKMVVQRHVVDGLDWSCIGAEFAQIWGNENQKSKRSLINYYNAASKKMAEYIKENYEIFDFDWLVHL